MSRETEQTTVAVAGKTEEELIEKSRISILALFLFFCCLPDDDNHDWKISEEKIVVVVSPNDNRSGREQKKIEKTHQQWKKTRRKNAILVDMD